MTLRDVTPGRNAPDEINVIVEIPANTGPVKYEVDKVSGAVFVDRFLATPMFYPCNYGYVPHTLAADGDPTDVLVVTPVALIAGTVVPCRPVGALRMTDESGEDEKILAVPLDRMSQEYRDVRDIDDLPLTLRQRIEHFFTHYKDLEPEKWVKVDGWVDRAAACALIEGALQAHQDAQ